MRTFYGVVECSRAAPSSTLRLTSSIGPNFGVIVPSVKVLKCVPSGLDRRKHGMAVLHPAADSRPKYNQDPNRAQVQPMKMQARKAGSRYCCRQT